MKDPFPWLARARAETPIFFMPEFGLYMVTRHEDVRTILRDTETYSSHRALGELGTMPAEIAAEVGEDYVWPLVQTLTVTNPPQHTRLKKLIQPMWTPRHVQAWAPDIRQIAEGLIDDFVEAGHTDLMANFASPLPPVLITKLVGAPPEMAMQFQEWVKAFFSLAGNADLTDEGRVQAWRELIEMDRYTRGLITEHRENPQEDLITDLIDARSPDGEPALTDQEIMDNVIGFIGGGSDTSAMLIAQAVYLLLSHPDQWERAKGDQKLMKNAIEETFRFRGPSHGITRTTTKEVELGGVTLPVGANLLLHLVSANRDEAEFENAGEFDIDRSNASQHLGLGKWAHFCLGGPLARLETLVSLECLAERLPGVRLAPEQGPLDYWPNLMVPQILGLEVEWEVAS